MANVCPTGLFFETQPIEEGLFEQPSCLQTHKHPSVCLQRKGGPALDLHANEEPQEETSLPIKGVGSPAAFVPTPACQHSLAQARARPTLLAHPPRPRVHSSVYTQSTHYAEPVPKVLYYPQHQPAELVS